MAGAVPKAEPVPLPREARRHVRRRGRRAISPIIATVMLVGITIAAGALLWGWRPSLPPQPTSLSYVAQGDLMLPTWGDGSENSKCPVSGSPPPCFLPAMELVLTQHSPQYISLSDLSLRFYCRQSLYLNASFSSIVWTPGTTTIGGSAPKVGHCGTFTPAQTYFNRFLYLLQAHQGSVSLQAGDTLVVYLHNFTGPNCGAGGQPTCDDDAHGAPSYCYTDPAANCFFDIVFTGAPQASLLTIPLVPTFE